MPTLPEVRVAAAGLIKLHLNECWPVSRLNRGFSPLRKAYEAETGTFEEASLPAMQPSQWVLVRANGRLATSDW